jgi:hypothetical protein
MATVTASYNWVSGETVTPTKLNTTAAPTVVVADNEVTTAKILDANVTNAKLASDIDASKLTTGTLPIARIADDAVTNDKLSLAANAGEIKKALNADNSPPIYACRAWVVFNGTTTPPTILASGNVSSVSRTSTGVYLVNFATSMPDSSYSAIATSSLDDFVRTDSATDSQVRVVTASAAANSNRVNVAIFR